MQSSEVLRHLRDFLQERLSLGEDRLPEEDVCAAIHKGVIFRGINVWVLVCAILIASIGLNLNSTAVIIGAMLISPLMGPIMGIGLAVGISDWSLYKRALRNFAVMMAVSLLTSTTYFLISPISQARSELLARTMPTIWDVMIALFGGMAGIVASASKERGNVLPGAAIATALMPPLCTAGYGLATGQWRFLTGALYLFLINTVFISLGTLAVVRLLHFRRVTIADPVVQARVRRIIAVVVLVTIGPSLYLAWNIVRQTVLDQNLKNYLTREFHFENTRVISWELDKQVKPARLDIFLIGSPLSAESQAQLQARRAEYHLDHVALALHQEEFGARPVLDGQQAGLLEDLYRRRVEEIGGKDARIRLLESQSAYWHLGPRDLSQLARESRALMPKLKEITVAPAVLHGESAGDTVLLVLARSAHRLPAAEKARLETWLRERFNRQRVVLLVEH